jgi:hypothetical protein
MPDVGDIVLADAQNGGGLLRVKHGGQPPQVEQFPGLRGDQFRLAAGTAKPGRESACHHFVDASVHGLAFVLRR